MSDRKRGPRFPRPHLDFIVDSKPLPRRCREGLLHGVVSKDNMTRVLEISFGKIDQVNPPMTDDVFLLIVVYIILCKFPEVVDTICNVYLNRALEIPTRHNFQQSPYACRIDLSGHNLSSPRSLQMIVDVLEEKKCFIVDWLLAGNCFDDNVCLWLSELINKQRAVREIDLRGNRVTDDGVVKVVSEIANKAQTLGHKDHMNPPPIALRFEDNQLIACDCDWASAIEATALEHMGTKMKITVEKDRPVPIRVERFQDPSSVPLHFRNIHDDGRRPPVELKPAPGRGHDDGRGRHASQAPRRDGGPRDDGRGRHASQAPGRDEHHRRSREPRDDYGRHASQVPRRDDLDPHRRSREPRDDPHRHASQVPRRDEPHRNARDDRNRHASQAPNRNDPNRHAARAPDRLDPDRHRSRADARSPVPKVVLSPRPDMRSPRGERERRRPSHEPSTASSRDAQGKPTTPAVSTSQVKRRHDYQTENERKEALGMKFGAIKFAPKSSPSPSAVGSRPKPKVESKPSAEENPWAASSDEEEPPKKPVTLVPAAARAGRSKSPAGRNDRGRESRNLRDRHRASPPRTDTRHRSFSRGGKGSGKDRNDVDMKTPLAKKPSETPPGTARTDRSDVDGVPMSIASEVQNVKRIDVETSVLTDEQKAQLIVDQAKLVGKKERGYWRTPSGNDISSKSQRAYKHFVELREKADVNPKADMAMKDAFGPNWKPTVSDLEKAQAMIKRAKHRKKVRGFWPLPDDDGSQDAVLIKWWKKKKDLGDDVVNLLNDVFGKDWRPPIHLELQTSAEDDFANLGSTASESPVQKEKDWQEQMYRNMKEKSGGTGKKNSTKVKNMFTSSSKASASKESSPTHRHGKDRPDSSSFARPKDRDRDAKTRDRDDDRRRDRGHTRGRRSRSRSRSRTRSRSRDRFVGRGRGKQSRDKPRSRSKTRNDHDAKSRSTNEKDSKAKSSNEKDFLNVSGNDQEILKNLFSGKTKYALEQEEREKKLKEWHNTQEKQRADSGEFGKSKSTSPDGKYKDSKYKDDKSKSTSEKKTDEKPKEKKKAPPEPFGMRPRLEPKKEVKITFGALKTKAADLLPKSKESSPRRQAKSKESSPRSAKATKAKVKASPKAMIATTARQAALASLGKDDVQSINSSKHEEGASSSKPLKIDSDSVSSAPKQDGEMSFEEKLQKRKETLGATPTAAPKKSAAGSKKQETPSSIFSSETFSSQSLPPKKIKAVTKPKDLRGRSSKRRDRSYSSSSSSRSPRPPKRKFDKNSDKNSTQTPAKSESTLNEWLPSPSRDSDPPLGTKATTKKDSKKVVTKPKAKARRKRSPSSSSYSTSSSPDVRRRAKKDTKTATKKKSKKDYDGSPRSRDDSKKKISSKSSKTSKSSTLTPSSDEKFSKSSKISKPSSKTTSKATSSLKKVDKKVKEKEKEKDQDKRRRSRSRSRSTDRRRDRHRDERDRSRERDRDRDRKDDRSERGRSEKDRDRKDNKKKRDLSESLDYRRRSSSRGRKPDRQDPNRHRHDPEKEDSSRDTRKDKDVGIGYTRKAREGHSSRDTSRDWNKKPLGAASDFGSESHGLFKRKDSAFSARGFSRKGSLDDEENLLDFDVQKEPEPEKPAPSREKSMSHDKGGPRKSVPPPPSSLSPKFSTPDSSQPSSAGWGVKVTNSGTGKRRNSTKGGEDFPDGFECTPDDWPGGVETTPDTSRAFEDGKRISAMASRMKGSDSKGKGKGKFDVPPMDYFGGKGKGALLGGKGKGTPTKAFDFLKGLGKGKGIDFMKGLKGKGKGDFGKGKPGAGWNGYGKNAGKGDSWNHWNNAPAPSAAADSSASTPIGTPNRVPQQNTPADSTTSQSGESNYYGGVSAEKGYFGSTEHPPMPAKKRRDSDVDISGNKITTTDGKTITMKEGDIDIDHAGFKHPTLPTKSDPLKAAREKAFAASGMGSATFRNNSRSPKFSPRMQPAQSPPLPVSRGPSFGESPKSKSPILNMPTMPKTPPPLPTEKPKDEIEKEEQERNARVLQNTYGAFAKAEQPSGAKRPIVEKLAAPEDAKRLKTGPGEAPGSSTALPASSISSSSESEEPRPDTKSLFKKGTFSDHQREGTSAHALQNQTSPMNSRTGVGLLGRVPQAHAPQTPPALPVEKKPAVISTANWDTRMTNKDTTQSAAGPPPPIKTDLEESPSSAAKEFAFSRSSSPSNQPLHAKSRTNSSVLGANLVMPQNHGLPPRTQGYAAPPIPQQEKRAELPGVPGQSHHPPHPHPGYGSRAPHESYAPQYGSRPEVRQTAASGLAPHQASPWRDPVPWASAESRATRAPSFQHGYHPSGTASSLESSRLDGSPRVAGRVENKVMTMADYAQVQRQGTNPAALSRNNSHGGWSQSEYSRGFSSGDVASPGPRHYGSPDDLLRRGNSHMQGQQHNHHFQSRPHPHQQHPHGHHHHPQQQQVPSAMRGNHVSYHPSHEMQFTHSNSNPHVGGPGARQENPQLRTENPQIPGQGPGGREFVPPQQQVQQQQQVPPAGKAQKPMHKVQDVDKVEFIELD